MFDKTAYMKAYRLKHRKEGPERQHRTKSEYQLEYSRRPDVIIKQKAWALRNYNKILFNSVKNRAKKRNLEFSLTLEDIVIPEFCPILGIKIIPMGNREQGHGASVDRIDSSKGYTKDNILLCSLRANMLKSNGTIEEFESLLKFLKKLPLT